jgi:hypothetical protein
MHIKHRISFFFTPKITNTCSLVAIDRYQESTKEKKSDSLYLRSLFNDLEIKARKKGGTRERKTVD